MKVINTVGTMREWSQSTHQNNETIAFVPTMGYLHEGHLSLIQKARLSADKTVVSIYVNPTQFAPGEDLNRYPRDLETDLQLCNKEQTDVVFTPDNKEIYSANHQTYIANDQISQVLCGKTRPTHFKGVMTIVAKFFNIIDPDIALFGQKDAQQAVILKNMVDDLNFRTKILIEPIVREKDGLAMSSRNKYLSAAQRKSALVLSHSLQYAEKQFKLGNRNMVSLRNEISQKIQSTSECKIDYVEFVQARTLQPHIKKGDKVLLALAVFVGKTRLIDNTILQF